ncbi:MAG: VRR-NUC domain-containing protein [Undibacterium sp.]|nr:VRR-NUC domain-containing protein [Opitutaceae bacterium]
MLIENSEQIPVGAMIARELITEGACCAYFTELWGGLVFVRPDLVCVKPEEVAEQFIAAMRAAMNGRLAGLPDVLAFFPDGRIVLREAKNVGAKDRLNPQQHEFARVARRLFGVRVDFAVVEWGHKKPNSEVSLAP